jgi:hypothetical protein
MRGFPTISLPYFTSFRAAKFSKIWKLFSNARAVREIILKLIQTPCFSMNLKRGKYICRFRLLFFFHHGKKLQLV